MALIDQKVMPCKGRNTKWRWFVFAHFSISSLQVKYELCLCEWNTRFVFMYISICSLWVKYLSCVCLFLKKLFGSEIHCVCIFPNRFCQCNTQFVFTYFSIGFIVGEILKLCLQLKYGKSQFAHFSINSVWMACPTYVQIFFYIIKSDISHILLYQNITI